MDLFTLIGTGDGKQIGKCISKLRDLTTVKNALTSDPHLVDLVDQRKMTVLHYAAQSGHLQLVQLFLNKGVKVNAKDNEGWTALHLACNNGHLEVIKELLIQGADIDLKNNSNEAPLHECKPKIKRDTERFLRDELPARRRIFLEEKRTGTAITPSVSHQSAEAIAVKAATIPPSVPPAAILPTDTSRQQLDATTSRKRDASTTPITALNTNSSENIRDRDVTAATAVDIPSSPPTSIKRQSAKATAVKAVVVPPAAPPAVHPAVPPAVSPVVPPAAPPAVPLVSSSQPIVATKTKKKDATLNTNSALNTSLVERTRESDAATATITILNTSLSERTRERDAATTTVAALNTRLTERTVERDAATTTIAALNSRLAERTIERDAAASTVASLNTRLIDRTRERDAAATTITTLNASLAERTKDRDNLAKERDQLQLDLMKSTTTNESLALLQQDLLYQRAAFETETKTLWRKLFGYLMAPTILNGKASVYINCLAEEPDDVLVEEALVTRVDKAFFCKLKEIGAVDESWRMALLQSIRDHKSIGVSIDGRTVPATNSVIIRGVSDEEKLAIRMYTVQMPVQYFQYLNRALNADNRTPELIREMKLYMRVLIRGLQALALVEGGKYVKRVPLAYRGLRIKDNEFYRRKVQVTMTLLGHHLDIPCVEANTLGPIEPFRVGEPITFSAFTSISLDAGTMDRYSDHLIYQFNDLVGLDVRSLSAYPDEEELLLPPPSLFQITALTPMPNKRLLMVHLKQLPPDASCLPLSPFPAVPHDHNLRQIFSDESRRPVLESSRLQELEDEVRRLREAAASASASGTPKAPRNLDEAYRVLHVKGYVVDEAVLQQLLVDSLGVLEAADLEFMDAAAVEAIAALLKPGGVGKFRKAMGV